MSESPKEEGTLGGEEKAKAKVLHAEPSIKVFPMSSVKKIIGIEMKEFGSITRVSNDASVVLYDAMLNHGRRIARRAIEYALRDNRKTVSQDDVKKAVADVLLRQ